MFNSLSNDWAQAVVAKPMACLLACSQGPLLHSHPERKHDMTAS